MLLEQLLQSSPEKSWSREEETAGDVGVEQRPGRGKVVGDDVVLIRQAMAEEQLL